MQTMAALFSLLLVIISLLLVSVNLHAATPGFAVQQKGPSKATATGTTPVTVTQTPTATQSPTPTATATNTPTATATATHTPTPTATATRIPTATATATQVPTATATTAQSTPTVALGTTPTGVVSTATATKKPTAATTATVGGTQTPTAISGNPTSNGNGNGGNSNPNGTPPGTQAGWLSLPAVIIGLLIVLGLVSAALIGLVMLRNRLLPPTVPERILPPSGAQPWKRVRTGSLNGLTNNQNEAMAAVTVPGGVPQLAPIMNATSMNTNLNGFPPPPQQPQWGNANGFPPPQQQPQWGNTNGFPPPQQQPQWGNTNGFPPPQQQPQWGNTNGFPPSPQQQPQWGNANGFPPPQQQPWGNTATNSSNAGFSPAPQWSNSATSDFPSLQTGTFPSRAIPSSLSGEQVALQQPPDAITATAQRRTSRPLRASIRLQAMQKDSGSLPAIPVMPLRQERVSEAMPSLNDPLLQDALEQYKLRRKLAQQEGNEGNRENG